MKRREQRERERERERGYTSSIGEQVAHFTPSMGPVDGDCMNKRQQLFYSVSKYTCPHTNNGKIRNKNKKKGEVYDEQTIREILFLDNWI
jgi:hypothetical protein